MQFYALEKDSKQLISSQNALKQKNYLCPECQSPVRLRSGPHRQSHFFHLGSHIHCNQHKKTAIHLEIQLRLQSQLPGSQIEKAYPEINRIADVSWENSGIVFEIQYSSISLAEVESRCRDYEKIGLLVVWILHDKRFNKRLMSESEVFLRQGNCYYTNIIRESQGVIYDQFDVALGNIKFLKGPPLKVNPAAPFPINRAYSLKQIELRVILARLKKNTIYFQGDLIERVLRTPLEDKSLDSMLHAERRFKERSLTRKNFSTFQILKKLYKVFLTMLLEGQ